MPPMASRLKRVSNNASPPDLLKKIVGSASSNSVSSLSSSAMSVSPSTSPGSTENAYPIDAGDNLAVSSRRKNLNSEEISKLLSTARIDRVNVETISGTSRSIPCLKF